MRSVNHQVWWNSIRRFHQSSLLCQKPDDAMYNRLQLMAETAISHMAPTHPDYQRLQQQLSHSCLNEEPKPFDPNHPLNPPSARLAPQMQKPTETSFEEDPHFRERYRERLLGPEALGLVSFDATFSAIHRLADARIEESRARGDFAHNSLRGKPLVRDPALALLDPTDYHLNGILKLQNAAPPWVEKHQAITRDVTRFREELDAGCAREMMAVVDHRHRHLPWPQRVAQQEVYACPQWEATQAVSLNTRILSLNAALRTYNLQAPMAAQKMPLVKEREIAACYARVRASLTQIHRDHHTNVVPPASSATPLPRTYTQHEDKDGLTGLFRSLFK